MGVRVRLEVLGRGWDEVRGGSGGGRAVGEDAAGPVGEVLVEVGAEC